MLLMMSLKKNSDTMLLAYEDVQVRIAGRSGWWLPERAPACPAALQSMGRPRPVVVLCGHTVPPEHFRIVPEPPSSDCSLYSFLEQQKEVSIFLEREMSKTFISLLYDLIVIEKTIVILTTFTSSWSAPNRVCIYYRQYCSLVAKTCH